MTLANLTLHHNNNPCFNHFKLTINQIYRMIASLKKKDNNEKNHKKLSFTFSKNIDSLKIEMKPAFWKSS